MTAPWVCPVCNRGVAPGVKYCDHGQGSAVPCGGANPLPRTEDTIVAPRYRLVRDPDPLA